MEQQGSPPPGEALELRERLQLQPASPEDYLVLIPVESGETELLGLDLELEEVESNLWICAAAAGQICPL